jgi:phosphatidylglycerol:prolipoprotein diacylglycerol transferase
MYPILFKLGPFELHAYGALLALSFFLGIVLASRRAPARGVSPDFIVDVSFAIVLASVVGSRLMYVLFHREELHGFIDVIAVWKGGMTMYGGVLAAMGISWLYARRRKISFLTLADIMSPSLALGLMVTRVGCFLNGCCYGKPTDSFLGIQFPFQNAVGSGFNSPLHPTQLYSSFAGLLTLGLLLWIDRRPRARGQLFAFYLMLASTGRFVLDLFRYYEANAYVLGSLTLSQVISIGLFLVGVLLLLMTRRATQQTVDGSPQSAHTELAEQQTVS